MGRINRTIEHFGLNKLFCSKFPEGYQFGYPLTTNKDEDVSLRKKRDIFCF